MRVPTHNAHVTYVSGILRFAADCQQREDYAHPMNADIDQGPTRPRETTIDIHVPELTAVLAPWRDVTIPIAAKGVPPHLSLLYPWRTPPLTAQDLAALHGAIADCGPFPITFTGLGRFSPTILFLQLADVTAIHALMRAIHTVFPDTPPYGGAFPDPTPHLTVAKATSDAELDQLEQEVMIALAPHLPLVVQVQQIVVMEENRNGDWHNIAIISLAH